MRIDNDNIGVSSGTFGTTKHSVSFTTNLAKAGRHFLETNKKAPVLFICKAFKTDPQVLARKVSQFLTLNGVGLKQGNSKGFNTQRSLFRIIKK